MSGQVSAVKRELADEPVYVLTFARGEDRFLWTFDEESLGEALESLCRFAANRRINFTWQDADVVGQAMRLLAAEWISPF